MSYEIFEGYLRQNWIHLQMFDRNHDYVMMYQFQCYFMPRDMETAYIVHSYLHFCVVS